MQEPETLFTFDEALPWIQEYIEECSKRKRHEMKCRKIVNRQRKRAILRWILENILLAGTCLLGPFVIAKLTGIDEILMILILSVPMAIHFLWELV